jgi:SHS2 domain-containing protein
MSFNFIDHTADIAVEVRGSSLEELFIESSKAWQQSVVNDTVNSQNEIRELKLRSELPETLLVNFLNELNYLLFSKKWLMKSVESIKVFKDKLFWNLHAKICGEEFSYSEHSLKVEIKAVTFHQLNIQEINGEYATRIIFDI